MSKTASPTSTHETHRTGGLSHPLAPYLVQVWFILISAATSLAITVALFDRTTLAGITRLWLASGVTCFVLTWSWWARPRIRDRRPVLVPYELRSFLYLTTPLFVACAAFTLLVYGSEEFHNQVRHILYYERLLSDSSWPINLISTLLLVVLALSPLRRFLVLVATGTGRMEALLGALADWRSVIPAGLLLYGILLSTPALMMINVNFWRYWATADGWATIGHYPYTLSDALQVVQGGVALYFVSFPLLPSSLTASFQLVGHNALASYLPIILANTLLPLGVFLALRETTGNHLHSLLFSLVAGSLPLLRNYTMDVGEADSLLMTSLVFSTYFRARANNPRTGAGSDVLAGVSAAVAAFARPEGALYVVPMYLASLPGRWRSRRYWVSVSILAAAMALFATISLREFGTIWPANHSGTINVNNFLATLEVAGRNRVFSTYAQALGISDLALMTLLFGLLLAITSSTIQIARRELHLAYLPIMALTNVLMVFFVGPVPAEASKFHDFFRHMSYGFPFLTITLGYGFNEAMKSLRGRWSGVVHILAYAGLAAVVLAELSLLEGPVRPGAPSQSPLMTSDVHVSATQLLVDPYPLPVMKFRRESNGYVPDMPEYMAIYPDDVYRHYQSADVRRSGNASEYYGAARATFLFLLIVGLVSSLLCRRLAPVVPRWQDALRPPLLSSRR